MIYNKELKLFEIECDLEYIGSGGHTSMEIVPKECPGGKGLCKKTLPFPIRGVDSLCKSYVCMIDNDEPGFLANRLYCRGSNSFKFIMEE